MKKRFLLVALVLTLGLSGTVFATQPDKQVYCNIEGKSGKVKAQISNGNTEHEYKLDGVFVHDENDVTAAMDAQCGVLLQHPKGCPAGTTLVDYENGDKQKPICKGEPTGCPYGDSIPLDSPKCVPPTGTIADSTKGEVKSTTPTPVDEPVYEEFQGK